MCTKTFPQPKGETQNDRTVKSLDRHQVRQCPALTSASHLSPIPGPTFPFSITMSLGDASTSVQCTAPHPLAKPRIQERLFVETLRVLVVCGKTKGMTPPQFLKSSQLILTQPSMANRMILPPHASFHLKTMPKSSTLYEMLPVRTDFDCDSDHSFDSRDHIKPPPMQVFFLAGVHTLKKVCHPEHYKKWLASICEIGECILWY